MRFPESCLSQYKCLNLAHPDVTAPASRYNLFLKTGKVGFLFKQYQLVWIGSVRESEFAAFVYFPHCLLHLLQTQQFIGRVEEEIIGHVTRIRHFERANVPPDLFQLSKIEIVQASVPPCRLGLICTTAPCFRSEEAIEVLALIRVPDEAVDLFIHKVDEYFAALLAENFSNQIERSALPAERVDKSEGRNQAPVPQKVSIK